MRAPTAWVLSFGVACSLARAATAGEFVLNRGTIVELSRAQGPNVRVAEARVGEIRALRIGAGAPTTLNPEIGVAAGPRALASGTIVDVVGTLAIPLDVSGAPGARTRLADIRAKMAEAEADDARRLGVGAALDAWIVALGTQERVGLETERAALDEALYAAARARRQAGTSGDFDPQLAAVVRADGQVRLERAIGERELSPTGRDARLLLISSRLNLIGSKPTSEPPLITDNNVYRRFNSNIELMYPETRCGVGSALFPRSPA